MEIKSRHHLRADEIDSIREAVRETMGVEIDSEVFSTTTTAGWCSPTGRPTSHSSMESPS